MKIAILLLAVLPFVLSAKIDYTRFLYDQLPGEEHILALAKHHLSLFGCDETEQQCKAEMCPDASKVEGNSITLINEFMFEMICVFVCKEAQLLAKNGPVNGVDPCAGGVAVAGH